MRKSADPLYDDKCLQLADLFLSDDRGPGPRSAAKVERDKQSLASAIQAAIDDWFVSEAVQTAIGGGTR
jgi:hypothetical protein